MNALKHKYSLLMADRFNRILMSGNLILFVLILCILAILWNRLPLQLPLYYSLPWGKEQIGTPLALVGIIAGIQALALCNVFCAIFTASEHPFFARILVAGGVGCVGLMAITTAKIILLVI